MSRRGVGGVCLLGLLFLAWNSWGGPNVKEGMWEYTVESEIPGMGMKMPAQKHRFCLTKEDLVPKGDDPGSECKTVRQSVKGDTVTWRVECRTDQGKAVMDGTITYKGDTFTGVGKFSQAGMQMEQRYSGKRLGPCK